MTIPHKAVYRKCKEKVSWRELVEKVIGWKNGSDIFVQGSWLARFLPQTDIYGIGIKIVILPEWSLGEGSRRHTHGLT
jgi:hypothetical protein